MSTSTHGWRQDKKQRKTQKLHSLLSHHPHCFCNLRWSAKTSRSLRRGGAPDRHTSPSHSPTNSMRMLRKVAGTRMPLPIVVRRMFAKGSRPSAAECDRKPALPAVLPVDETHYSGFSSGRFRSSAINYSQSSMS